MTIPMKYEDVVAKLDAALAREAALREELETEKTGAEGIYQPLEFCQKQRDALQQRLTVAEQRAGKMEELLREAYEAGDHNIFGTGLDSRIDASLKPAEDGEKDCLNCKVCMGSPGFPEDRLINGVKP